MPRFSQLLAACALTSIWALSAASPARADGLTALRGPAPTTASLEAAKGPFAIGSAKLAAPDGYGAATVYYPTDRASGPYGLVVLGPGFLAVQNYYAWLAERAASHGFVVLNMNVKSIFDTPEQRGPQMLKALSQVLALSQSGAVPYAGLVDGQRVALMGHSAGGGGALLSALAVGGPTLKAVVAITPASTRKDYASLAVPTLILSAEKDTIAPNKTYSLPFFASLNPALDSAYIEIAGASHLSPTFLASAKAQAPVGKYAIAWLKRFVDGDERYTPFVKTSAADMSASSFHGGY